MTIYAIIVTYNAMRRNWIDRCMQSLLGSTISVKPIVVDNNSIDGTRKHVPEHYPEAVWLPQDKNIGFGQANNVGINYALQHNADYVMLLNQDAAIMPDTLSLLLKESDGISLITPIHLNGNGSQFDINFQKHTLPSNKNIPDNIAECRLKKGHFIIGEVCAACWLLPAHILKTIGGFNPLFFQYGEDNNYYDRLIYHHIKSFLVPSAEIHHDRQGYGDSNVYNNKKIRRTLLLLFCDINQSFWSCTKELIWHLKECFFHKLPNCQYMPGTLFVELIWIMSHSILILKSRRKEKRTGMHWL